ncbi:probable C-terminal domain small phosphatase [Tanacetum coccineum]
MTLRQHNIGRRCRLHHLGEYVITLYKNGKLRTRVTVTLVGGAEGTSSLPFWTLRVAHDICMTAVTSGLRRSSSSTLFFSLSGLAGSSKDSRMGRTESEGQVSHFGCCWLQSGYNLVGQSDQIRGLMKIPSIKIRALSGFEYVVIVDDDPRYTILQRKNAIRIRPFTDDLQDHELKKIDE